MDYGIWFKGNGLLDSEEFHWARRVRNDNYWKARTNQERRNKTSYKNQGTLMLNTFLLSKDAGIVEMFPFRLKKGFL